MIQTNEGYLGIYKGYKILNENQFKIIEILQGKTKSRKELRELGVDPRRSDLRYLERIRLVKSTEKYEHNSKKKGVSGTRYYVYSLN